MFVHAVRWALRGMTLDTPKAGALNINRMTKAVTRIVTMIVTKIVTKAVTKSGTNLMAAVAFVIATLWAALPVAADPHEWTRIDMATPAAAGMNQGASGSAAAAHSGEVWVALAGDRAPGAAFTFTSPAGISVLFDPWYGAASGSWGLWFPDDGNGLDIGRLDADAMLAALPELDRDISNLPDGTSLLGRLDGTWDLADVRVIGFADNNISLLVMGGMRILIWGEGLPASDTTLWADIGAVDVLLLPIDDSQTSLSYAAIATIIDRLAPDIVIPGLYLSAGVAAEQGQLGTAEAWTRQQNYHTILREPRLSLTREWVHSLDRHVQYFGNHHLLN